MSEENKTPRTIRKTLDRKFGVSESRDERRPRREERTGDDREFGRGPRGDRPRGLREDGSLREGRTGERRFDRERKPFDRERRPRRFDDRPFGRSERFGHDRRRDGDRPFRGFDKAGFEKSSRPIYRQRPEQKSDAFQDENLDESVLEARAAQAETVEESAGNPPWFKKLLALRRRRPCGDRAGEKPSRAGHCRLRRRRFRGPDFAGPHQRGRNHPPRHACRPDEAD